jgi:molybdate/tungstate transport system substrate-binding protein
MLEPVEASDARSATGAADGNGPPRRSLLRFGVGLAAASGPLLQVSSASAAGIVKVLYAGSLLNLMEHSIGPAFDKATGGQFHGFAGGSVLLANQVKGKLRQGDVFISAVPEVNTALMGADNGSWVSWYVTFGESPLVIGYSPSSKYAPDFRTMPWYEALVQPGIRIGSTDPKLDPKGRLTVQLLTHAADHYNIPNLEPRALGAPENPAQVLPEETLVVRLQSGQLDAAFFYSIETSDAKIPTVNLPSAITPKAVYTATVLRDAPNPAGARQFVTFLLGHQGQTLMHEHGLTLRRPALAGDAKVVPQAIRVMLRKAK